jgi:hypothetical protein
MIKKSLILPEIGYFPEITQKPAPDQGGFTVGLLPVSPESQN